MTFGHHAKQIVGLAFKTPRRKGEVTERRHTRIAGVETRHQLDASVRISGDECVNHPQGVAVVVGPDESNHETVGEQRGRALTQARGVDFGRHASTHSDTTCAAACRIDCRGQASTPAAAQTPSAATRGHATDRGLLCGAVEPASPSRVPRVVGHGDEDDRETDEGDGDDPPQPHIHLRASH